MSRLTKGLMLLFVSLAVIFILIKVPVLAGEMKLYSNSGDNVSLMGDIKIDKATSDNVVVTFGNADIEDNVDGSVVTIFGNTIINAGVSGDVVTIFGKVNLKEKAEISGNLVTIGSAEKNPDSRILGQEIRINTGMLTFVRILITLLFAFFILVLGLLIIVILKKRFQIISLKIEQKIGRRIAIGILGFFGLLILFILLFITVIFPLIYIILLLIAEVTASIYFGKQVLKLFCLNFNIYIQFIIGLIVISLFKVIIALLIPGIGFLTSTILYVLFSVFAYSLGIGILIDSKFGSHNMGNI